MPITFYTHAPSESAGEFTDWSAKVREEKLKQQIRGVKIQGLQYQLRSERFKTQTEWVKSEDSRIDLETNRIELYASAEKYVQAQEKVRAEQAKTNLAQVETGKANDHLHYAQAERRLSVQLNYEKLDALGLKILDARAQNTFDRSFLQLQGRLSDNLRVPVPELQPIPLPNPPNTNPNR